MHPKVAVEIVAATRRATQQRSGLDIEVVVGEPQVTAPRRSGSATTASVCTASRDYLAEHGTPENVEDLARYPLVYFIDSMLQVDDLDLAPSFAPAMRESVTSTNVFVHVEATRAAAGIGLLPCFMADRHDDLVRVLPEAVSVQLTLLARRTARDVATTRGRRRRGGDPKPDDRPTRRAAWRAMKEGTPAGVPSCQLMRWSRIAPHRGVRTRHVRLLLNVVEPSEMIDALRWARDDDIHSVRRDGCLSRRGKPTTAAASPLASIVANPNFFIFVPSSFLSLAFEPCGLGLRVTGFVGFSLSGMSV